MISSAFFFPQKNVPFSDFFQVEPLQSYHRVILAEDFMKHLAPTHWPKEKRRGYCWLPPGSNAKCVLKVKDCTIPPPPQQGQLSYFITFFIQVPTLGLKIMTGYWTMSGQDEHLSRQTFSWSVILTGQVHGFQINNWKH